MLRQPRPAIGRSSSLGSVCAALTSAWRRSATSWVGQRFGCTSAGQPSRILHPHVRDDGRQEAHLHRRQTRLPVDAGDRSGATSSCGISGEIDSGTI